MCVLSMRVPTGPISILSAQGIEPEAKEFLLEVLKRAGEELERADKFGEPRPVVPSQLLSSLYRYAIENCDGRIYSEIQYLEKIFVFPAS